MSKQKFKPEDVLKLKEPTKGMHRHCCVIHPYEGFLCKLSDNVYNVEFLEFRIRDMDTNKIFFDMKAPEEEPELPPNFNIDDLPEDVRIVKYDFGPEFLDLKTIGTRWVAVPYPDS